MGINPYETWVQCDAPLCSNWNQHYDKDGEPDGGICESGGREWLPRPNRGYLCDMECHDFWDGVYD